MSGLGLKSLKIERGAAPLSNGKWQRDPRVIGKKGGFPAFCVGASLTLGMGRDIAANDSNTGLEQPARDKE